MATTTTPDTGDKTSEASTSLATTNGNGRHDIDDPRTRLLLEQLLAALNQPEAETAAKAEGRGLGQYVAVLRRRWKAALALAICAFALVGWKMRPAGDLFTASVSILLPTQSRGADAASQQSTFLAGLGLPSPVAGPSSDTQIAIISSPALVKDALLRLKPGLVVKGWGSDKVDRVAEAAPMTGASAVPGIINLTVTARDGEAATGLANALVAAYSDWTQNETSKANNASLELVRKQKQDTLDKLVAAKRNLQAYKEESGVPDIATAQADMTARQADLYQKMLAARTEADAGATSEAIVSDSIVTNLQQQANDARLKHERLLRDFYPSSPEARESGRQLASAQRLVDLRTAALMRAAQNRAKDATDAYQKAVTRAGTLPRIENKLTQLIGEVEQLGAALRALADRETALNLMTYADASRPVALRPSTGAIPAGRTWSRTLMLAAISALAVALLLTLLLEQFDHSLHTPDEVEATLRTAVLGSMPFIPGNVERRLALVTPAQAVAPLLLESCRSLRSNLTFATVDRPLRSVLITSADPGEGKSLCALNLATVMALDGRRVILLDCDLRRPTQHLLGEAALEPGFTNVLDGEASLQDALASTSVSNLWLLPAGSLPTNPPALLGGQPTRDLIAELQGMCDIVVIDSPPVLSLADAQVLSALADGVVLVVAADATPKEHVQRMQSMLRHAGGRLLGVIFNKVKNYNNPDVGNSYYYYADDGTRPNGGNSRALRKGRG